MKKIEIDSVSTIFARDCSCINYKGAALSTKHIAHQEWWESEDFQWNEASISCRNMGLMQETCQKQHKMQADEPWHYRIFGDDDNKEKGPADSSSSAEFGERVRALKVRWDQKELNIRNVEVSQFHACFVKYKASEIKEMMIYPVQKDTGLGYNYYYNNANESINNSVKRKTDCKRCKDDIEFLGKIREIKDIQQRNIERAVICGGPYRLRPE